MTDKALNESAWKDVNEAVGEALGVSPADPVQDRAAPGDPEHGASSAKMVPLPPGGEITAQAKVPDNGVRYYNVTAKDLREEYARRRMQQLQEEVARRNLEEAARAHPAFRADGSLAGYYSPMQGDAATPDVVDAAWWLTLPKAQAIWELGLRDEAEYLKVYNAVAPVVTQVENRRAQMQHLPGYVYVPIVLRRRKRRVNSDLFVGGKVTTIKPMTDPDNVPRVKRPWE